MTDEFEKTLERLLNPNDGGLPEEEFTSGVMIRVRRYQRRSALYACLTGLGLLAIAWLPAAYLLSSASAILVLPGEATLSAVSGQALAQLPVLFLACVAAAGYLLLNSES